jgi:hypothetical protein
MQKTVAPPHGVAMTVDVSGNLIIRYSPKALQALSAWSLTLSKEFLADAKNALHQEIVEIERREKLPPTRKDLLKRAATGVDEIITGLGDIESEIADADTSSIGDRHPELLEDEPPPDTQEGSETNNEKENQHG